MPIDIIFNNNNNNINRTHQCLRSAELKAEIEGIILAIEDQSLLNKNF